MDPRIFMRGLEEQLRRVKSQYMQIKDSKVHTDLDSTQLLNNARVWLLRTLQNTDLEYNEMHMPAVEFLVDESFSLQKSPPYRPMYPSILWLISTMPKKQIETIFGVPFHDRLKSISGQLGFSLTDERGNPERSGL